MPGKLKHFKGFNVNLQLFRRQAYKIKCFEK